MSQNKSLQQKLRDTLGKIYDSIKASKKGDNSFILPGDLLDEVYALPQYKRTP